MTQRVVEPMLESDIFSRKAPVQKWPKIILEEFHTHEIGYMHPDRAAGRPSPIPLMNWVDSFISVICSNNNYRVRGALEYLLGQVFRLAALGNLTFEIVIQFSQLCRSFCDSELKLILQSRNSRH